MPITQTKPYEAKTYTLQLENFSAEQLEQHYKLYQGYVTQTNGLNDKLKELSQAGKLGTPEYNELRRRFGFEYDGMRLHEYYFENLCSESKALAESSKLGTLLKEEFGSIADWEKDFRA